MPDFLALALVIGVLVALGAVVVAGTVLLARRYGIWVVIIPPLSFPMFLITILYLPLTGPIIVVIFVASFLASWSRWAHRALPWAVALAFTVGA
ncbi:MAG: hypothetical protein EPO22_07595, partial [Dehalococcoidia bacterium]